MKKLKNVKVDTVLNEEVNSALYHHLYRTKFEFEFLSLYVAKQKQKLKFLEYFFAGSTIFSALAIFKEAIDPTILAWVIIFIETLKILKPKITNFNINSKEDDLKHYRAHTSKVDLLVLHYRSKIKDAKETLQILTKLKNERTKFFQKCHYDKIVVKDNDKLKKKAQAIALLHISEKFNINGKNK